MTTTSRSLALVVAILSSALPIMAQAQQETEATKILNNMFKVYSRLASYQDEGILIATVDEPTGGTIEKMPFKTFFKRPKLFRFEWTDYVLTKLGRTKVIWFNGKEAFTYWEPDRYEKEESLSLAVAGATGVSSTSVNTVIEMLLPDEPRGVTLKELTQVSLAGEEVFEGVSCYRIKGFEMENPVELWVGKNDFLLRKLRREMKYRDDGLRITEDIRRKIQVDQSIPEVVFNYKPPIALTPSKDTDLAEIEKSLNPGPPVWTEFKSEEGRFSISMPAKPASQTSTAETGHGRFEQHAFIASHSPLLCMAAYMDIPKKLLVGNGGDGFFEAIRDQFIKQVEGKLASETSLSLDGHAGREIKVHMFHGELRLRIFMVGDRLYLLSIMLSDMVTGSHEEAFKKFFGSFKLSPITKPVAAVRGARQQTIF